MLNTFIESCQELIFPSSCLECDQRLPCKELPLLCEKCLSSVENISSPRCISCGMPFETGQDHLCGLCLKKTYDFDLARAAVYYRDPVTSIISSLKFNGTLSGLATLGQIACNSPGFCDLSEPDIIIPIPLHVQRLKQRKFNQALLIGQACFPDYRKRIIPDILARHRATSPQTGLSGVQRRKNLSKAFSLKKPELVQNKAILLVDDVFTTGQTVHECAKVLRRAGAKRIEVFTLARAM